MACDSTWRRNLEQGNSRRQEVEQRRGPRGGGREKAERFAGEDGRLGYRQLWWFTDIVSVFNATDLYTDEWLQ